MAGNRSSCPSLPENPCVKDLALGKLGAFTECQRSVTRQRHLFCRVPFHLALGKSSVNSRFADIFTLFCRGRFGTWQNFAECPKKALCKACFAVKTVAVWGLPSAALGKTFAECNWGFAKCLGHSAKSLCPLVLICSAVEIILLY